MGSGGGRLRVEEKEGNISVVSCTPLSDEDDSKGSYSNNNATKFKQCDTTLDDIETKLETMAKNVEEAINENQLTDLHESLQVVNADLKNVIVEDYIILEERKSTIVKKSLRIAQKISKRQTQLSVEGDNNHQSKTSDYLEKLDTIERELGDLTDQFKDLKEVRNKLIIIQKEIDSVEDIDQKIILKKSEIFDLILSTENSLAQSETEEVLTKSEHDINVFNEQQEFQHLKNSIDQILPLNESIFERKQELLQRLDNILRSNKVVETNVQEESVNSTVEETSIEAKLLKITENLQELKPKIGAFVGTKTGEQYFQLTEALTSIFLELDNLRLDRDSPLHSQKINLLKEANELGTVFEKQTEQKLEDDEPLLIDFN